ncbi:MAG: hypothetical protein IT379_25650 [Deltaproteobacteria bacterium]|nr:hypothetical protein [Deltaproteobacteria bacterium]
MAAERATEGTTDAAEPVQRPAEASGPTADGPAAERALRSLPPVALTRAGDDGGPGSQRRALASRLAAGFVGSLATRASPSEITRLASVTSTLPGLGGGPRVGPPIEPITDDATRARELVRELRRADLAALDDRGSRPSDPRAKPMPKADESADVPFLARLASSPSAALTAVSDVSTVLAVARAGSLAQRRAAVARLGVIVTSGDDAAGDAKRAVAELTAMRDVELTWDVERVLSRVPGQAGKEARSTRDAWRARFAELASAIGRYWDGEGTEPLTTMEGSELVGMALRLREAPDVVVAHAGCVLAGGDATIDLVARLELLAALRPAGDPRLVPSLAELAESAETELRVPVARVLSRIDDPRVKPVLTALNAMPGDDAAKIVIAGALALAGDPSGLEFVARHVASDDADLAELALDALHALPSPSVLDDVVAQLRRNERPVVLASVRALGRVGDMRAIAPLVALRNTTRSAGVRAEVEDALVAVRARLELRGEAANEADDATLATVTTAVPAKDDEDGSRVTLRAMWKQLIGLLWSVLGATERAIRTFEQAARAAPRWTRPLTSAGFVLARAGEDARALAFFRRALELDAAAVTSEALAMRALLRVALSRADVLSREGRREVARGVLDEVLALDLRRASPELRFEIARRARSLRDRHVTGEPTEPRLLETGRGAT